MEYRLMISLLHKFLAFGLFASTCTIHGGIISFNNWDSSEAAISGYTVTIDDTGTSLLHNFTFTGDIDGLGIANDTLSFTIVDDYYEGSTFSGDTTTSGTVTLGGQVDNNVETNGTSALHFGVNTFTGVTNGYLETGNTFELSMTNVSYVRGEAGASNSVTFNGFSAFNYFISGTPEFFVGENGNLTGTSIDSVSNGTTFNFGGSPVQSFSFTQTDGVGTERIRVRDLDFAFDVDMTPIPEPSSLFLIVSLGAFLGLSFRRRRA